MRLRYSSFMVVVVASHLGGAFGQEIHPAFDRARKELRDAVSAGKFAGVLHLVVRDGKVVHQEIAGAADLEGKQPLRADTLVRMYSMTKPVTSVAAMMLHERGKFQLDDAVAKFIPAFKDATVFAAAEGDATVRPKRPITVRDVLRHTSGYGYGSESPRVRPFYQGQGMLYREPAGMLPPKMSIEKAAEALARIPTNHQPGERFTYGFNTDLLGRLIEIWSGRKLDEQLRVALFEPLAMEDSGFSVAPANRGRLASCYTSRDGKLDAVDPGQSSPFNEGFEFISGGGGLVSTAEDYAHFCQLLVDGGQYQGKRLIGEETLKEMFTDQLHGAGGGFRFGLGFAINDVQLGTGNDRRKSAEFSWAGYASTAFRVVPEAKLFQIVVSQYVPNTHELSDRLIATAYEGIGR